MPTDTIKWRSWVFHRTDDRHEEAYETVMAESQYRFRVLRIDEGWLGWIGWATGIHGEGDTPQKALDAALAALQRSIVQATDIIKYIEADVEVEAPTAWERLLQDGVSAGVL